MENYYWIVTDYYFWWLSSLFLFLVVDICNRRRWPSVFGIVLNKKIRNQKYQVESDDDYAIPMEKEPTFFGGPVKIYVKCEITLKYEYEVEDKKFRQKKIDSYIIGEGRVVYPEKGQIIKVLYDPKTRIGIS